MKIALLTPDYRRIPANLGNEAQTIAVQKFLPKVDYTIDWREMPAHIYRKKYNFKKLKEEIFCVFYGFSGLKGWEEGLPMKSIKPLIISMHIKNHDRDLLKNKPDILNYLREHEPIGCRDKSSARFLQELGVKAYFSGCFSLTLDRKDFSSPGQKRKGIFFVDAPLDVFPKNLWNKKIRHIKHNYTRQLDFSRFISVSNFFAKLKIVLVRKFFVTLGLNKKRKRNYFKHKIKLARYLLSLYANAEFVATTRLHVALPCLAFGTPVLFVYKAPQETRDYEGCCHLDDPRFDGLTTEHATRIDSISFREGLAEGKWLIDGKMTHWSEIKNPNTHLEIADKLRTHVKEVVSALQ